MTRLIVLCAIVVFSNAASAQDFSFGFKTGLNFSNLKGDAEQGESFDQNIGFHFGASFAWNMTDLMGLRGEFLYSQKGTKRNFEGPSYYNFYTSDNEIVRTTAVRKQELNVNNSYIELPITFFVKPINRVEIFGGASFGLLVNSSGFGNIALSDIKSSSGSSATPNAIDHELDFNYIADNPGARSYANPASTIKINNQNVPYPQTAGAYSEFVESRGKLYKAIDFGLVGGVSVYLSKSLYVSGRLNYGLVDVTKTKADVSLSALDENQEFISRDDDDRNFSTQISIGFSF